MRNGSVAVFVSVLLLSSCATAQLATPVSGVSPEPPIELQDDPKWTRFEMVRHLPTPGYLRPLRVADADGVYYWWVFYVQPGVYSEPVFRLTTNVGVYEAVGVMFSTTLQQVAWSNWPTTVPTDNLFWPFNADPAICESELIGGKTLVVAYVRFSEQPRGDLVSWEVIP